MSYKIGQYRFEGAETCVATLGSYSGSNTDSSGIHVGYRDSSDGMFKDVAIEYKNGEGFSPDHSYYMYLSVPKDMNYDMGFTLKLMGSGSSEESLERFQVLDTVFMPKGGTGKNSYLIALYRSNTDTSDTKRPKIAFAEKKTAGNAVNDAIYYEDDTKGKRIFYRGTSSGRYEKIDDYNDMFITASWRESYMEDYPHAIVEIVFRPIVDGFNQIVLEMNRTGDDFNIQWHDNLGKQYYGRRLDIAKMDCKLGKVNNLIPRMGGHPLSKINVQSHSGLSMAVNGEHIKVGPSGLYELDAIPVTSLGVVAKGFEDNFIINYMYETEE